jgi:hypothetical protein
VACSVGRTDGRVITKGTSECPGNDNRISSDVFTRRIVGFGVERADIDGVAVSRPLRQGLPRRLSTDHDPLFRFHRWRANLRILDIEELKSIPSVPRSHPFVERLTGRCDGSTSIGCLSGMVWTCSGSWSDLPPTTISGAFVPRSVVARPQSAAA